MPVWALDAGVVDADSLGIRTAVAGDRLGARPERYPAGRRASWWSRTRRASTRSLFGEPAPATPLDPRTQRIVLFAVGVDGVPAIHVEEALWVATDVLETA